MRPIRSRITRTISTACTTAALLLAAGASLAAQAASQASIDVRSYRLGGIGAFAEIVAAGVKKMALSAVMTSNEMDALIGEAQVIASRNHARLYRETDLIVTDLFPADVAVGQQVLVVYTGTVLEEYQVLKRDRTRLVAAGRYTGAARTDIARRFGRLLSYPEWKIDALLKETKNR